MRYAVNRQALRAAGFPDTPVYCGWKLKPRPSKPKPDKVKDVHGEPGSKRWRRMDEVAEHPEQGDMLGLNIFESWLTCLDADERHPVYKNLIKALPVWETSISGKGTHLFTRARVPEDCPQQWYKDGHKLEVYGRNARGRFIALTGNFLGGKRSLEDVLDEPPDLMAMLLADGWAPGSTRTKVGPVAIPAELPPAPRLGELDAWAALLDARDKDDPERGNGPWGRMAAAKQSRWSAMALLMDRAALLVGSPAELASWWYASFPALLAARGGGPEHAADRDREVARAWAGRPEPADAPIADFPGAIEEDAADQNDGDIGGGALVVPFLSHVDIAKHYVTELRNTGSDVVFDETNKHTYFLDPSSGTWILDEMGSLGYEVLAHMQNIMREVANQVPEDAPKETRKMLTDLRRTLGNMVFHREVCKAVNNLAKVHYSQLDTDPYLIGTPSGVIDPRQGTTLRKALPTEYVTKRTAVTPDFSRQPDKFLEFLASVFPSDPDTREFLRRWFGYVLTGSNKEQMMLFCYGQGANGKSTLINAFSNAMGAYSRAVKSEIFMAQQYERHDTEIAQLRGVRLATATEINKGQAWNEARLKRLTGGEPINARFMYADMMEFRNTAKIMISGNTKPRLAALDHAMTRRVHLLEFKQKFAGAAKNDKLDDILAEEAPLILAWGVTGAVGWIKDGLKIPAGVVRASEDYFDEEDTVKTWLTTCTYQEDKATHCVGVTEAFQSYVEWLAIVSPGAEKVRLIEFRRSLEEHGIRFEKQNISRLSGVGLYASFKPKGEKMAQAAEKRDEAMQELMKSLAISALQTKSTEGYN